jgi:hypothetical protein
MGDNSAYPMTCHYIIGYTFGICATLDAKNNNKKNDLNLKTS